MPETEEQRRRFFRRRMLKGARISLHNSSSVFSCTVRDISERGARLRDWQHDTHTRRFYADDGGWLSVIPVQGSPADDDDARRRVRE